MQIKAILSSIFFLSSICLIGQGIEFFDGSWADALKKSEEENKLIFVDAYTKWCGPCKRMAKTVFKDAKVGEYYNANFINMKIDMEGAEGKEFNKKYRVRAYPTFFYIRADGKVIHTTKGGRNNEQFIALGREALSKYDNSDVYAKKYEAGDRSFENTFNYIKSLRMAGKSSRKIANEYLNEKSDLSPEEKVKIYYAALEDCDSKLFDHLIENKSLADEIYSKEKVEGKIEMAINSSVKRSCKFKSIDLLKEAQNKYKKYTSGDAVKFNLNSNMEFAKASGDGNMYVKNAKKYCKKYVGKNALKMHKIASDIVASMKSSKSAQKYAMKLAKSAAENGGKADYYFTWAKAAHLSGDNDSAVKIAEQALEVATENNEKTGAIQNFIQRLKNA